jgi:glutamyl-tRNA reductase
VPSIDEVVVLSTCNRVEVYAAASGPAGQVTRAVTGLVASRGRLRAGEVLRMARTRVGGAAAEHLFSVAGGLDSMAIGEEQIVAQIKAAARAAAAAGTTGPVTTGLIDAALRASKRARTQTAISTEGISLARAGLDVAAAHLGGLAGRHAVVLGTGSTGRPGRAGRRGRSRTGSPPVRPHRRPGRLLGDPGAGDRCGRGRRRARAPAGSPAA